MKRCQRVSLWNLAWNWRFFGLFHVGLLWYGIQFSILQSQYLLELNSSSTVFFHLGFSYGINNICLELMNIKIKYPISCIINLSNVIFIITLRRCPQIKFRLEIHVADKIITSYERKWYFICDKNNVPRGY